LITQIQETAPATTARPAKSWSYDYDASDRLERAQASNAAQYAAMGLGMIDPIGQRHGALGSQVDKGPAIDFAVLRGEGREPFGRVAHRVARDRDHEDFAANPKVVSPKAATGMIFSKSRRSVIMYPSIRWVQSSNRSR
ncbi:MAG: hypothetical protein ACRERU_18490, partial [Methylococcales bacterium]